MIGALGTVSSLYGTWRAWVRLMPWQPELAKPRTHTSWLHLDARWHHRQLVAWGDHTNDMKDGGEQATPSQSRGTQALMTPQKTVGGTAGFAVALERGDDRATPGGVPAPSRGQSSA